MEKEESSIVRLSLKNHGKFNCLGWHLELTMAKYLPASLSELRILVSERTSIDYSDLSDIASALIVLAEFDFGGTEL